MALLSVAFMLTLAQAAQPGSPEGLQSGSSGLIVGQVVDGVSGRPVANAIVSISGLPNVRIVREPGRVLTASAGPARGLTGSDGRFVFRDLPSGSFGIGASKMGYSDGAYGRRRPGGPSQQLLLADGERVGDVVVRMWKQAAITGRVVDEAGEPLVAISVRAFRRQGFVDRRLTMTRSAVTDDRGIYRLALLDPGEYVVGVASRNATVPLPIAQSRAGTPAGDLSREIGGASLPGTPSAIQLGDQVYMLGGGTPIPPTSGERLFVYPPVFYPSVSEPTQASSITLSPGEEREGIDLLVAPVTTVRVSGTVMGIGNNPGLPVRLVPTYQSEIALEGDAPVTVTDGSGAFSFAGVPPGDYLLQSTTRLRNVRFDAERADDLEFAELPLTVGRTDIHGLVVPLRPGLRISGRFEFEGTTTRPTSLTSVQIAVESAGGSLPFGASGTRAGNAGTFSSAALVAGRYFVRVTGSPRGWMFKSATLSGRDVADTPLELRDGDVTDVVITFSDRWSGLSGTVLTAAGAPDPDAVVIAFPTDPQTWSSSGFNPRRLRGVRTAKSGQYTFATLPPGEYYVAALPGDQAVDWREPRFLESASRNARRITIGDGERPTQDLRTQGVK